MLTERCAIILALIGVCLSASCAPSALYAPNGPTVTRDTVPRDANGDPVLTGKTTPNR
jgi:hypothetical protein